MFEQGFAWRCIVERHNPSESLFPLQFVDLNHTLVCLNRDGFFSRIASRRAARSNVQPRHRFLSGANKAESGCGGALIIKWNRDWIGSSCHCRTRQQGWSPTVRVWFDWCGLMCVPAKSRWVVSKHGQFCLLCGTHTLLRCFPRRHGNGSVQVYIHTHTLSKNKGGNEKPFSFN